MKIKDAIAHMGLTRTQLASKMEVSYETVKKWERENKIPLGPARILFWRIYEEKREEILG